MTGQAVIGNTDVSDLIVDGSYNMDLDQRYESWLDGNGAEHRSAKIEKTAGSFDVILSAKTMTLSQFYSLVKNSTADTGATLCGFASTTTGTFKAINAYLRMTNKEHTVTSSGFVDIVTVEVQER